MGKLDLFEALWGMITDDTGKVKWVKILLLSLFFSGAWVYGNFDKVDTFIGKHSIETYKTRIEEEKQLTMNATIPPLLKSALGPTYAQGVGVWLFRPRGAKTYVDLKWFDGLLMGGKTIDDYQGVLTDMTQELYEAGNKGWPYSYDGSVAEPYSYIVDMYMYTCPIFDSKAQYAGQVTIYWKDNKTLEEWHKLSEPNYTVCFSVARQVGIYL